MSLKTLTVGLCRTVDSEYLDERCLILRHYCVTGTGREISFMTKSRAQYDAKRAKLKPDSLVAITTLGYAHPSRKYGWISPDWDSRAALVQLTPWEVEAIAFTPEECGFWLDKKMPMTDHRVSQEFLDLNEGSCGWCGTIVKTEQARIMVTLGMKVFEKIS